MLYKTLFNREFTLINIHWFSACGTHSEAREAFVATGKAIHCTGVTLARIEQGKIVVHLTWWERKELEVQIR